MKCLIQVIAHRGASGYAPENTLPAFKKAIELNVDMIEFDIQLTIDNQVVVIHDKTVDRTTNGKGKVEEKTFESLRKLDAGTWFDSKFIGTRIPTLRETLNTIPSSIKLNIELKTYNPESSIFEQEVAAIATEFDLLNQAIFAARHPESINRFKAILPNVKCVLLQKERTEEDYIQILDKLDLQFAQIRRHSAKKEFIDQLHEHEIVVNLFYADDPEEMKQYIEMGVDGILTNYPDRLQKVIQRLEEN